MSDHRFRSNDQLPKLLVVAGIVALLWIVYLLAPALPPFLIALVVAYLANPAVTYCENKGVPRTITILCGSLTLAGTCVLAAILLWPTLEDQITRYRDALPGYAEDALKIVNSFATETEPSKNAEGRSDTDSNNAALDHTNSSAVATETLAPEDIARQKLAVLAEQTIPNAGSVAAKTAAIVKESTMSLIRLLSALLIIPVVGFYLLRDWNRITEVVTELIPESRKDRALSIARTADEVLGGFMRGQGLVMLSLAIIYSIGLFLIGVDFSLLIGICAGLLSFVPFLGTAIGLLMATLAVAAQSLGWQTFGLVIFVFCVGQFIEGNFLTPRLVGDKIDFHPVAVIFAIAVGAQLLGIVGVLIALPLAAVMWAVIKDILNDTVENEQSSAKSAAER